MLFRIALHKEHLRFILIAALLCSVPIHETSSQDTSSDQVDESTVRSIEKRQPTFLVRAKFDRVNPTYREGDSVEITAVSEKDGYLYAYYENSEGDVLQLFPNEVRKDNRIRARQAIDIPGTGDRFNWIVGAPYGEENVRILVTADPLTSLEKLSSQRSLFSKITDETVKGMEVELLASEPTDWAVCDLDLTTYPAETSLPTDQKKRMGLFIGVTHYRFNTEHEQLTRGEDSLNAHTCHRSARQLSELMSEFGQLDGVRLLTNEQATKQNIKQAIINWLPESTTAGDEVFIYFTGHGTQLRDLNGDEPDGLDEAIMPHDAAMGPIVELLLSKFNQGAITVEKNKTEVIWLELALNSIGLSLKNAPKGLDLSNQAALNYLTNITDDELAYWLMRLDNRKVTVIVDACHSGGMAIHEKGGENLGFNFLNLEINRLSGLGQGNIDLVASASAQRSALERPDDFPRGLGPFPLMSSYLIELLLTSKGSVQVHDAYEHCNSSMESFFNSHPEIKDQQHRPILYPDSGGQFYIRP